MQRRTLLISATTAFGARLAGARRANAANPFKVGFVYVGPIGDLGWTYQHDQGRLAMQKELGEAVSTQYVENVGEGPDAERVIRQLVSGGNQLIYTTSFGYMNPTERVAKASPAVEFEQATGYKTLPNMAEYNSRFYEGRAVCGAIAGHMSKGVVGYVASFPIPEVVMGINAFTLAARKVNPNFQTKVIWVNTWFDPGRESDAAKSLIDQGADILAQHTDSPAVIQTAEARGVFGFGQSSDMSRFGEKATLTSIVDNWAPYYIDRTKLAITGKWKTDSVWWGIKEGMVQLAPWGPSVTEEARAAAEDSKNRIAAGTLLPFAGPIKDQKGAVKVADGKAMSDDELLKMNWYVEGVQA
ncbi:MAG: BMP family ABC transporter substrate-binding protein [Acetobacteraceae bacterium]|nr:BMP family ABC transporter substrate-binding protein [Acetobacteraceae bacterium]